MLFSDCQLTQESGILALVEKYDEIMADKGFPYIEIDVVKQFARLVMPPIRREGRQFNQQQNLDGYTIASIRIHVERAIARLKHFGILNFVEHYLYKVIHSQASAVFA